MEWNIARAKESLSMVIQAATNEPQQIFDHDQLVAVVINGDTFKKLESNTPRRSIGEELAEFRKLCAAEEYEFPEA